MRWSATAGRKGEGSFVDLDGLPTPHHVNLTGALRNEIEQARERGLAENLYQGFLKEEPTEAPSGVGLGGNSTEYVGKPQTGLAEGLDPPDQLDAFGTRAEGVRTSTIT